MSLRSALFTAALLAALPGTAAASERHFTYTYESNVLNPGDVELEPWTTWRAGRESYYSRFDQRLEFEFGVVPDLQMAWYWNMTALTADETDATSGQTTRVSGFEFGGVSNEWKYKLSDSFADSIGSALYFEWTAAPAEAELEAKVILDKRMGNALVALNLVGEHEWEFEAKGDTKREIELEADLAFGYFLTPTLVLGLEARSHSELEGGKEHEVTAFSVGPSVAYAQKAWWMAATVQPQVFAIKGEEEGDDDSSLDLEHHERVNVRVLFGMDL
ncbi:MAG: hypothetical protein IT377_10835 [Polyangiaceae bacterium]|nr:hypothetical protein [Polyangiaceae bacterium]